jgi:hypothetical protein
MGWSNFARRALFSVAICCVTIPEAEAIEIFAPPGLAAQMADGAVSQVRYAGEGVRAWRRRRVSGEAAPAFDVEHGRQLALAALTLLKRDGASWLTRTASPVVDPLWPPGSPSLGF